LLDAGWLWVLNTDVMFENIEQAAPDPILGLTEIYNTDPNPEKINLGVGIYQNEQGKTPVLPSVKRAEELLLKQEASKSYLPIPGTADYGKAVQTLLFGPDSELVGEGRTRRVAQVPFGWLVSF